MKTVKLISGIAIYTLLACGSVENTSIQIANDNIQKTDTLINFQNDVALSIPKGFKNANTCTQTKWVVTNEGENKVVAQQAKNESNCFNILVLDNLFYKNFVLSVKMKAVAGEEDQGGGLVWRYIDNKNYYIARCNPLENNFRFYKVVNGNRKELKSVDCTIRSGEWFTMIISMNENKITCSLNGNKIMIEASDDTYPNAGKIGLWTKSDAQTYFDDLSILPINH